MKNSDFVKKYYQRSGTISRWWDPENLDPQKNILRPFKDIFVKEARDVIKESEGDFILDVGTGRGRLLNDLVNEGAKEIVALDLSREMLRFAKNACSDKDEINYICSDVENLCLDSNIFDVTISLQTLVHVPDAKKAINELSRVTKKGGKLIFDITNENISSILYYFNDRKNIVSFLKATLGFVALYFPYGPLKNIGGPWRQYSVDFISEIIENKKDLRIEKVFKYNKDKPLYTLFIIKKLEAYTT
jgi:ubiquinone/menaquinone biosynthesis C-methylase UbiE